MRLLYDKDGVYNLTMVITTIVIVTAVLIFFFYNNSLVLAIGFRWYQPAAFVVIALLAQIFFKLNDTREQTKILESEFYRLQNAIVSRSNTLLKVILFYFLSLIVLSIFLSILDITSITDSSISEISGSSKALVISEKYVKFIKLFAISYVVTWSFSIINAYHVYREIADYKAKLALNELIEEGRKNAVKRLRGN